MVLACAPVLFNRRIEPHSLATAAWIYPLVKPVVKLRRHRVETAMVNFSCYKSISTVNTGETRQPGEELEEDLFPGEVLLLSQVHNEFVDVPRSVGYMLGYDRAMEVYEDLGFGAHHPVALLEGEEGVAVDAPVEGLLLILKE